MWIWELHTLTVKSFVIFQNCLKNHKNYFLKNYLPNSLKRFIYFKTFWALALLVPLIISKGADEMKIEYYSIVCIPLRYLAKWVIILKYEIAVHWVVVGSEQNDVKIYVNDMKNNIHNFKVSCLITFIRYIFS